MKFTIKALTLLLTLVCSSCLVTRVAPSQGYVDQGQQGYVDQGQQGYVDQGQQGYVSFQVFYDDLSPYGYWVNNPDYGYVWIPDVGPDFVPYSRGHWVLTDFGWTWVSAYDWGWAPFHYGRWDYSDMYGWFWVPGNEWGPAWVTWRRGDGYYGWAPLRPGVSINAGFEGREDFDRDYDRWTFVRDRDFDRSDLSRYYINRRDNNTIIRSSTVINNTYVDNSSRVTYIAGPRPENIQTATGRSVTRVAVRDNDRPGQKMGGNELKLYRPRVESTARVQTQTKPAPSRVVNPEEIHHQASTSAPNNRRVNVQQGEEQQRNIESQRSRQQVQQQQSEEMQKRNEQTQQESNRRQLDQQKQSSQQQQQNLNQQKNLNQQQQQNLNQRQHLNQQQQQNLNQQQQQSLREQRKQDRNARRLSRQQNKTKTNPPEKKDKDENNK